MSVRRTGQRRIGKGFIAMALAAMLSLLPPPPAVMATLAALVITAADSTPAEARSRSSRSSGGYSRTTSTRSSSSSSSSSSSGGYSRPRTPSTGSSSFSFTPSSRSSGDRATSRTSSGSALDAYRSRQDGGSGSGAASGYSGSGSASSSARSGSVPSSGGRARAGANDDDERQARPSQYDPRLEARERDLYGQARRTPSWGRTTSSSSAAARTGWGGAPSWAAPRYAMGGQPQFGIWQAMFLWYMLDSLNQPSHAAFFHNQSDQAAYQQWRAEAEAKAADNPELAAKLADLDRSLAAQAGKPRDPNYLPPDVDRASALAEEPSSMWPSILFLLVVGGVVVAAYVVVKRMRGPSSSSRASATQPPPWAAGGTSMARGGPPSWLRIGSSQPLDPTPFLLLGDQGKVLPPEGATGSGMISVTATGTLVPGFLAPGPMEPGAPAPAVTPLYYRLYLPGDGRFLQMHLGPDGMPDECRYFSTIDEVAPADPGEWGFWLDEAEGAIGWPEFQTKDGKIYNRVWSPGGSRIAPQALAEGRDTLQGRREAREQAMLYAAPTGLDAPAPSLEYILVAVVEEQGQAYVRISAGIDINPSSLALT